MSRFGSQLIAMPGIEAALSGIKSPVCIASSSAPERLQHTLSLVGLFNRFNPHIFSATQVGRGKPAPDLFLFAAKQMGVEPRTCLVVEDSVAGVMAAVDAGMRVIGFTGGSHCRPGHSERLRQAGAAEIINNFKDFLKLSAVQSS
jgi:HAD superfamily hydrolase (TIGR01509 family)